MRKLNHGLFAAATAAAVALQAPAAAAADWSDTSLGYRYGTKFAEPFIKDDIAKSIVNLTHASGYKYGTNFFNADVLFADSKDPVAPGSTNGSQEVYLVYRHTLDLGKVMGQDLKAGGFMRGVGLTAGFDFNVKNDAGYNSNKRMFVLGPTLMADVPGFLNISLLFLWESNAPYNDFTGTATPRYTYDTHAALDLNWGIPLGAGFSFKGYGLYIGSKGKNEFGDETAAETHIDMRVMYDLASALGLKKESFEVGLAYEYWKNKFGNDSSGPAGGGAFAKTPMIRAEYHF